MAKKQEKPEITAEVTEIIVDGEVVEIPQSMVDENANGKGDNEDE